jgi:hypothetical protein
MVDFGKGQFAQSWHDVVVDPALVFLSRAVLKVYDVGSHKPAA